MRDLSTMPPEEILAEYFAEKRRRESPPSLAGIDPEAPKERKPSSGRYEELLLLTRGCSPVSLKIMYEASSSYRLANWRCPVHGCDQVTDHEHRPVLGTDGKPLTAGGVEITQPVCNPVPPSVWAKRYGISDKEAKRMVRDVLDQVAEHMARRKRGAREERERMHEGPTIEDVRALARRVLG